MHSLTRAAAFFLSATFILLAAQPSHSAQSNACARAFSKSEGRSVDTLTAKDVINHLGLSPLPGEGGFFKETYRSSQSIPAENATPGTHRPVGTAIYYLITPADFSAMHRLKFDEIFHFYIGSPAEMLLIFADGSHRVVELGTDLRKGQVPQIVVPAGTWQGSRLKPGGAWALLGTTMSPGFDFADFELGQPKALNAKYPELGHILPLYTRVP